VKKVFDTLCGTIERLLVDFIRPTLLISGDPTEGTKRRAAHLQHPFASKHNFNYKRLLRLKQPEPDTPPLLLSGMGRPLHQVCYMNFPKLM
jgi:hypothetical protein